MQVFITGASGHIGAAVTRELLGAGHEVVGLARSDTSAAALAHRGSQPRSLFPDLRESRVRRAKWLT